MASFKRLLTSPEWWWRHSVAGLLTAQLWLNQHYLPRKEYIEDKAKLTESLNAIERTVAGMSLNIELLKKDILQIMDHEGRLRSLENSRNRN